MIRLLPFLIAVACVPAAEVQSSAETNALTWCDKLQLDCKAVSCMSRDTDLDGYVSCTVVLADSQRVSVDCAHKEINVNSVVFGQNQGCRQKLPVNFTPSLPE